MPNFFPTLGHQRKVRRDCVSTSWSTRKKRKSFFTFTVLCWAPEHRTTTKASRWRWPSPKNKARTSAAKCSYTRWERHRIKNLSVLEETWTRTLWQSCIWLHAHLYTVVKLTGSCVLYMVDLKCCQSVVGVQSENHFLLSTDHHYFIIIRNTVNCFYLYYFNREAEMCSLAARSLHHLILKWEETIPCIFAAHENLVDI